MSLIKAGALEQLVSSYRNFCTEINNFVFTVPFFEYHPSFYLRLQCESPFSESLFLLVSLHLDEDSNVLPHLAYSLYFFLFKKVYLFYNFSRKSSQ